MDKLTWRLDDFCLPNLNRLMRWFGLMTVIPAVILPIYQQFLHGGRDAASILPRTGEYLAAHMVGAMCSFLLIFGLIAIYLRYASTVGKFGIIALMVALFGQMAWAGGLLVDGTFNPLLAIYNPEVQTNIHAANQYTGTASMPSAELSSLIGVFEILFDRNNDHRGKGHSPKYRCVVYGRSSDGSHLAIYSTGGRDSRVCGAGRSIYLGQPAIVEAYA